jgi:hypothetical protein
VARENSYKVSAQSKTKKRSSSEVNDNTAERKRKTSVALGIGVKVLSTVSDSKEPPVEGRNALSEKHSKAGSKRLYPTPPRKAGKIFIPPTLSDHEDVNDLTHVPKARRIRELDESHDRSYVDQNLPDVVDLTWSQDREACMCNVAHLDWQISVWLAAVIFIHTIMLSPTHA